MKRIPKRIETRDTVRKRRLSSCRRHGVPALLTHETAALVLSIISAQRQNGLRLDQIHWQHHCRDSAVAQVVTRQLARSDTITEESSRWN